MWKGVASSDGEGVDLDPSSAVHSTRGLRMRQSKHAKRKVSSLIFTEDVTASNLPSAAVFTGCSGRLVREAELQVSLSVGLSFIFERASVSISVAHTTICLTSTSPLVYLDTHPTMSADAAAKGTLTRSRSPNSTAMASSSSPHSSTPRRSSRTPATSSRRSTRPRIR